MGARDADARTPTARGRLAERRVAALLESRGYVVLGTNVRVGRDEIDIVALDGATLVVVEVRARRDGSAAHPFETVNPAKARKLRRAALQYLADHDATDMRIDVASVVGDTIEIVENALDFTST